VKTGKKYRNKKRNNDKRRMGGTSQGNIKALNRYYKPDEWWKLDHKTRKQILQICKNRKLFKVLSSEYPLERSLNPVKAMLVVTRN
jgi:hypothetical protein